MEFIEEFGPDKGTEKYVVSISGTPARPRPVAEKKGDKCMATDTERLNFLLRYFLIDDIGDEEAVPGVIVFNEELEEVLTWGQEKNGTHDSNIRSWEDDLRVIIDRAILAHKNEG